MVLGARPMCVPSLLPAWGWSWESPLHTHMKWPMTRGCTGPMISLSIASGGRGSHCSAASALTVTAQWGNPQGAWGLRSGLRGRRGLGVEQGEEGRGGVWKGGPRVGVQSWALTTEARCFARNKKAHTSWNMGAILEGDRRSFARCGPRERLAEGMILRAREGNYDWIYGILRDGLASADVADAKGYTVLAAAAVSLHAGCPRDCGPVAI